MSKKYLLLFLLSCFSFSVWAQHDEKEENVQLREIKNPKQVRKPFADKLFVGAALSFAASSQYTQFEFSPHVGYRLLNEMVQVGIGGSYIYERNNIYNLGLHIWNFRAFGRLRPFLFTADSEVNFFAPFHIHGELEVSSLQYVDPNSGASNPTLARIPAQAFYIGPGYNSSLGKGFGVYFEFLYNTLFDRNNSANNVYTGPWHYRFGFYYGF